MTESSRHWFSLTCTAHLCKVHSCLNKACRIINKTWISKLGFIIVEQKYKTCRSHYNTTPVLQHISSNTMRCRFSHLLHFQHRPTSKRQLYYVFLNPRLLTAAVRILFLTFILDSQVSALFAPSLPATLFESSGAAAAARAHSRR